jgi:Protein of unknown function DUF262
MNKKTLSLIDGQSAEALDEQVKQLQKITDFEIREYPVEVIVQKFVTGLEDDDAELFIPDYQREFIWSVAQQSRFIESLLLNLPIPYIFVADVGEGEREGKIEIIDGSQRVRTLVAFIDNELVLQDLKKITHANGFTFEKMSAARQMRFKRKTLRLIELTQEADEEARREIFDRLNTGGTAINSMEQRRGTQDGPFVDFLDVLAKDDKFKLLCPVSQTRTKHNEYQELALRYFAYCEKYTQFSKSVQGFLDEYLQEKNKSGFDITAYMTQVQSMLDFVEKHFPSYFKKDAKNTSVPRIRFEAIAVGVTLALKEKPYLCPSDVSVWLESKEFKTLTRSDASNSRPKVKNRIHFVRDHLLGRPVEYDSKQQANDSEDALK